MPPVPSATSPAAPDVLERQFLDMRGKLLSLAADFDRIQRSFQGETTLRSDARVEQLRQAAELLRSDDPNRAEKLQMLFSDLTPAVTEGRK